MHFDLITRFLSWLGYTYRPQRRCILFQVHHQRRFYRRTLHSPVPENQRLLCSEFNWINFRIKHFLPECLECSQKFRIKLRNGLDSWSAPSSFHILIIFRLLSIEVLSSMKYLVSDRQWKISRKIRFFVLSLDSPDQGLILKANWRNFREIEKYNTPKKAK